MNKRWAFTMAPLLLVPLFFQVPNAEKDTARQSLPAANQDLANRENLNFPATGLESGEREDLALTSTGKNSRIVISAGDFLSRWQQEMSKVDSNPCATAFWPWDEYPRQVALRALEEKVAQRRSCPAELLWRFLVAADPSEAAASLANASHPGLKLYRALTLAGMMEGAGFTDTPPIDLALARRLLLELGREDPNNSAPLQFLAAVEGKLGEPLEKSISLFEAAFSRPNFNLYGVELWQCLAEISDSDIRYYFVIKKAIESAPAPGYWRVVKAASDLVPLAPSAFFQRMEESSLRALALFENEKQFGAARFYEDSAFKHAIAMRRVAHRGLGKNHGLLPLPSEGFAWSLSVSETAREYAFPRKKGCNPDEMPRYAETLAQEIRDWRKKKTEIKSPP